MAHAGNTTDFSLVIARAASSAKRIERQDAWTMEQITVATLLSITAVLWVAMFVWSAVAFIG